ncbi:MAG: carboxypeptidase-like regulatory domain-containing protein [Planctomycetota bacterium]
MFASIRGRLLPLLAVLIFAAPPASAQGPIEGSNAAGGGAAVAPAPAAPRLAFVGASISAGFGNGLTLAKALEATTAQSFTTVDASDLFTFSDEDAKSLAGVEKALAAKPDAVVALDFLFWFAYGFGKPAYEDRKASLERGLALLERFECPIYVGLIPHITDASRAMLAAESVPSAEQLAKLDAVVKAWAEKREKVTLLPVPEWLTALKTGAEIDLFGAKQRYERREILNADNLHLSRRGTLVAAALVARELAARKALDAGSLAKDLAAIEKRADEMGTSLTVVVKEPDGKLAREGHVAFRLKIPFDPELMAALSGLSDLQTPQDLAKQNPIVLRGLPLALLEIPAPEIRAYRGDFVTKTATAKLAKGDNRVILLTLERGREIAVTVRDAESRPVAGVEVVSLTERRARKLDRKDADPAARAVTDAEGRCVLRGLGAEEQKLSFRREGRTGWTGGPTVAPDAAETTITLR